jgi:hypothetical protein
VVYALIRLQLGKLIWQYTLGVIPIDVPVRRLVVCQFEAKHLDSLLDHTIAALASAEEQLLGL